MNRTQRRKLQKTVNKETVEVIKQHSISTTVTHLSAALVITLKDKLGLNKEQIQTVLKETEDVFDSLNKRYINLNDLLTTIEKELEIVIK